QYRNHRQIRCNITPSTPPQSAPSTLHANPAVLRGVQLHAHRIKIDAAWEASFKTTSSDMSDEEMNDWGALHREAERAMMAAPIATLTALRAKLTYIKTGDMDVLDGDDEYPAVIDLVLRDADRLLSMWEAAR
ncbi:hypothetical protein, partial [Sphingobium sp. R-7]|uniref:hypothetical protein n=1 Tax=Sphingobium sp. R-7 TaxID=3375449 RepID=UPI00398AFCFF